ncbi:MAG: hypothetical protein WC755_09545, partial [Candidatus Woesearchaeota archaeon]
IESKAEKNTDPQKEKIFVSNVIFSNPKNIGVSVNELSRFLRNINAPENTQLFIDAVMDAYYNNNVHKKELDQLLPDDINSLAFEKLNPIFIECIKSSNINEIDKKNLIDIFEYVHKNREKYLKVIGEKSVSKLSDDITEKQYESENTKCDSNKLSELENRCNDLQHQIDTINYREFNHFDIFYADIEKLKKCKFKLF